MKSNFRIIMGNKNEEWNKIVKSFKEWDVYYLYEYSRALQLHGDGEPILFIMEKEKFKACYVAIKSDIAHSNLFGDELREHQLYDLETPYGYGGPMMEGESISDDNILEYVNYIKEYCVQENIVTQFFRFHPLLDNGRKVQNVINTNSIKQTIYIDTFSKESIWTNMESSRRNRIRKAEKDGITVSIDKGKHIDEFIEIYKSTMEQKEAEEYYFFNKEYFYFLIENLKGNIMFINSWKDGKMIASLMILYNQKYMHYHLGGTRKEYRQFAPTNLMFYEAALWGNANGIHKFHLGGGMSTDDSLFRFKKQFNKTGRLDYYVGRIIFNQSQYDYLLDLREKMNPEFNRKRPYMIQYRG